MSLEFDKPEHVMKLTQEKQRDYWERGGRLSVGKCCIVGLLFAVEYCVVGRADVIDILDVFINRRGMDT